MASISDISRPQYSELSSILASGGSFLLAVGLVIAMPISWMPLLADYRFARKPGKAFHGTYWGYFLANVPFYGLGALPILATGETDIVKAIAMIALGIPALLLILVDEPNNGFADIYSAAVSIQNLAPKIPQRISARPRRRSLRRIADIADRTLRTVPVMDRSGVHTLFGVVIMDHFIVKRGGLDVEQLYTSKAGYWYHKGVNLPAVLAWVLSFLFYYGIVYYKPELEASIPTLIFTALIYWVFMKAAYRR